MDVQQIGNLNLEMQNVLPAQTFNPVDRIPDEVKEDLNTELPETKAPEESSKTCSCVDTYA